MKKKRCFILVLMLFFVCSSFAYAGEGKTDNLTKTYTFKSQTADFAYSSAKKEIKEKGKTYELTHIEYELLSEEDLYESRTKTYWNLSEKTVPLKRKFRQNGKPIMLYAEPEDITFSETVKTVTEQKKGASETVDFSKTKNVSKNGRSYEANLVGVKEAQREKPFTVQVRFQGKPDAAFYFQGKKIQKDPGKPTWRGYEQAVLHHLQLPQGSRILDGTWIGGWKKEDDDIVRYGQFTGTQPIFDYTATYQYSTYSAVVTYNNQRDPKAKEYTVKAICHYEKKGWSLVQKIIAAGVGILLFSGLITLVLYILSWRKKKKEA